MKKSKVISVLVVAVLVLMPLASGSPKRAVVEEGPAQEKPGEPIVVIDSAEISLIVADALREAHAAIEAAKVGEAVRQALADVDFERIVSEAVREAQAAVREVDVDRIVREATSEVDVDAIVAEAMEAVREAMKEVNQGIRIEVRRNSKDSPKTPKTPAP